MSRTFWSHVKESSSKRSKIFEQKKPNISAIDGHERKYLGTRQAILRHTEKWLPGLLIFYHKNIKIVQNLLKIRGNLKLFSIKHF